MNSLILCLVHEHICIDVLVIPTRIVKRFTEMTSEEVSDLFLTTQRIGKLIEQLYGATSLTVAIQDGPEAGQSVEVRATSFLFD